MKPAEYLSEIVIPTVEDFLSSPGDRRKAYLAAIATYHLTDYIMRTKGLTSRNDRGTEMVAIETAMKARHLAEFEIVAGLCHGTKHCGRNGQGHNFTPGDEKQFLPFGFGPGCGGFDNGRWGGPGLQVEHDGVGHFVDECIRTVLRDFQAEYQQHLGGVGLGATITPPTDQH